MAESLRTVFYDCHLEAGAKIVAFGGWDMPLQYEGILQEHLATRKGAGLFDVSHMGRFYISGDDALPFLQHALSNNAASLDVGLGQYTMIPNESGGVIDDAYLYRFVEDEYLLVVNAANREKDWNHLETVRKDFPESAMVDRTFEIAMLSLQGPGAREVMEAVTSSNLPDPMRNELGIIDIGGASVLVARTGYTGEPICFELFIERDDAVGVFNLLTANGAKPIGLGARDSLRLEAGLPLYGHELGLDPEGNEIPAFASDLSRFAVSFSPLKGDFIGREPLFEQFKALKRITDLKFDHIEALPRRILLLEIAGRGISRPGDMVFKNGKHVGFVTSGTMVPYWNTEGEGVESRFTDDSVKRAIAMALVDSDLWEGDEVTVEIRGRETPALVVPYLLRGEAPPFARSISHLKPEDKPAPPSRASYPQKAGELLDSAIANTRWRQRDCINLIPSEMTMSPMTRMLSIMDPVGRYAEHKQVKALDEAEVFYYQGTEFIWEVEELLKKELMDYLGCGSVEARLVSGQMANATVFSAMVDYRNRADRKSEQARMRMVMNNHIIKGGHLSSQPMGALKDYVARDPRTEKAAAVNFPVYADDKYRIDTAATRELLAEHKPELVILGKSMVLYPEPVAELRQFIDELGLDSFLMYDMAHVLGLIGPHFQNPFAEGADIVTGSTHKTFFGTQRGIISSRFTEDDLLYPFWEAVERRAFPGAVSNHHLGTLLGLLMATYEMNAFKDSYQANVIRNAKAFAKALKDCGLNVSGNPDVGYTQTHQVLLDVGWTKGPEIARKLEENNIIVNYQAAPEEEGFTASGSLRMGVSEMTRFGMGPEDFGELAELIRDIAIVGATVKPRVAEMRKKFLEMNYCFTEVELEDRASALHALF
ncbi:MAG: glycine cleavage system aminomethyltransferase GcvT [Xanthomonadales bacterium]|jgi:aminomethyltransferase|nr:glycine cleavage system aminomethyltransferase GcvT [Xanthomonadales bacterium]